MTKFEKKKNLINTIVKFLINSKSEINVQKYYNFFFIKKKRGKKLKRNPKIDQMKMIKINYRKNINKYKDMKHILLNMYNFEL